VHNIQTRAVGEVPNWQEILDCGVVHKVLYEFSHYRSSIILPNNTLLIAHIDWSNRFSN